MKLPRDNTQYQAALLCDKGGVDTPVKNSLCCIAAGITALPSSPTEVLTPHDKLREAATPDATLIAQNRPPAQHAVGYKPPFRSERGLRDVGKMRRNFDQRSAFKFTNLIFSVDFDSFKVWQMTFYSNIKQAEGRGYIASKVFHPVMKLISQFKTDLHSRRIQLTFLNICKPLQLIRKNGSTHFVRHVKVSISLFLGTKIDEPKNLRAHTKQLLRSRNLKPFHILSSYRSLMKLLIHRNRDRYSNRQNSTNRLHPARRIRWQPSMLHPICNRSNEKPQNCATHDHKPQNPKCAFNHFCEDIRVTHTSWLLAIKSFQSLPHFPNLIQGDFT